MEIPDVSPEKMLFALQVIAGRRRFMVRWDLGKDRLPAVARFVTSVSPMVLNHPALQEEIGREGLWRGGQRALRIPPQDYSD
jgi:hypothetical protein